uniref:2-Hacid_dh_C domain-containing protein n=1 Tax=Heligmosomoides polygyrus TaxID=6339 RepID=A0A183F639_HELPZ
LNATSGERYGAECKTVVFDFESENYNVLEEELKTLDVGILVNCAGIAPDKVANFMELSEGLPSKILRVNLMSNIKMNEIVIPGMVRRNRGCVVNVSSMTVGHFLLELDCSTDKEAVEVTVQILKANYIVVDFVGSKKFKKHAEI